MKDKPQKKKRKDRRKMLERAKQLTRTPPADWDFLASKAGLNPSTDNREPYAGNGEPPHS